MPRTAEIDAPETKPATKRKSPKGRSAPAPSKRATSNATPQRSTTRPHGKHPEVPARTPHRPRPTASKFPTSTTVPPSTPTSAHSPASNTKALPAFSTPTRPSGTPKQNPDAFGAYVKELSRGVKLGDDASLQQLREMMAEFRDLREFFGNLARKAEQDWIKAIDGGDARDEEAIRYKLMVLRTDLVGDNPTPMEEIVADNVGVSWLASFQTERASAKATAAGNPRHMASASKAAESAQRRYLSAVRSLEEVQQKLKRKTK